MITEKKVYFDKEGRKHTEENILGYTREEMIVQYKDCRKLQKSAIDEWFDEHPKPYYTAKDEYDMQRAVFITVGNKPIRRPADDYCDDMLDRIDNSEDYE